MTSPTCARILSGSTYNKKMGELPEEEEFALLEDEFLNPEESSDDDMSDDDFP